MEEQDEKKPASDITLDMDDLTALLRSGSIIRGKVKIKVDIADSDEWAAIVEVAEEMQNDAENTEAEEGDDDVEEEEIEEDLDDLEDDPDEEPLDDDEDAEGDDEE